MGRSNNVIHFKAKPRKIGGSSLGVIIPSFLFKNGYLEEGKKYKFVIERD